MCNRAMFISTYPLQCSPHMYSTQTFVTRYVTKLSAVIVVELSSSVVMHCNRLMLLAPQIYMSIITLSVCGEPVAI